MTPKDTVPLDFADFVNMAMLETLKPHVDCANEDGLIVLRPLRIVIACKAGETKDVFGDLRMTQIDIVVGSMDQLFDPHRYTLVGVGKSAGESIQGGVAQWVEGTLPMLKAVFGEPGGETPGVMIGEIAHFNPAQPSLETSACWRGYWGQYEIEVLGMDGGAQKVAAQLEKQPLADLVRPALGALHHVEPDTEYCWLNLMLGRPLDSPTTVDCLLNNEPLPGGAEALAAFEWPDFSPMMAIVRQYAIFKRIGCDELPEPPFTSG